MLLKKSYFFDDFLDFSLTIFLIFIKVEIIQALRQDIIDCCTFIQTSRRVLENHLDTTDKVVFLRVRQVSINFLTVKNNLTITCII